MNRRMFHLAAMAGLAGIAAPVHALVATPVQVPVLDSWGLAGLSLGVAAAAFFVSRRRK